MNCAYLAFTAKGLALAQQLAQTCPGSVSRCGLGGVTLAGWTAQQFAAADALVFVGAAGIAVRAIAPHCRNKAVDFVPSRIGSYWLNDINGDTEIDVMAVDHQKKQVFAGECKYHNKPVDATVYYELEEKVKKSSELRTAFPGYKVLYGLFSKSGFTQRMLDQAEGRDDILLIQEDHIL